MTKSHAPAVRRTTPHKANLTCPMAHLLFESLVKEPNECKRDLETAREGCSRSVVGQHLCQELIAKLPGLGLVLEVVPRRIRSHEHDVGDAARDSTGGGVRIDAERGRAGVGGLADQVRGTGI